MNGNSNNLHLTATTGSSRFAYCLDLHNVDGCMKTQDNTGNSTSILIHGLNDFDSKFCNDMAQLCVNILKQLTTEDLK